MDSVFDNASLKTEPSYQLLFERNPLPMWIYDVQTQHTLAVNPATVAKYGYSQNELLKLSLLDLHHPDEIETLKTLLQLPVEQHDPKQRWRHRHRDGDVFDVELESQEFQYHGVHIRMVLIRDVTQQLRAERSLLEEGKILSAVVNASAEAIITADTQGRILMFNPGAERIFRHTRDSMLGQRIEMLLPERYRAQHVPHRHQFSKSQGTTRMMGLGLVKGLRGDGEEIDLEGSISHVTLDHRKLLIVCLKDVTDRVRASIDAAQSRAQLSELTQRLMSQEKTLIKRLAQVLHDQLGQTIAAIRMAHDTVITLQDVAPAPAVVRLQTQMGTLISQAVRQVRRVLVDLRPPLLEEQGLAAALDNELRNRSLTHPNTDISIHVKPQTASTRWPTDVEYAVFMVAREAVENALRHSGASAITVRLEGSQTMLTMEVSDNGSGFAADASHRVGHLGLLDMRERAHAVGATFCVNPGAPVGTCVRLNWKLAP